MKRDPYFDNLKFILIALMVLGHAIVPQIEDNPSMKIIYFWIYTFHMPCFFVIAGYFARLESSKSKLVVKYIVPYFIFQTIYTLYLGHPGSFFFFDPDFAMWFILSLLSCHLLLPFFAPRIKSAILISVGLSMLAGILGAGNRFALAQTAYYLPFFLGGYLLKTIGFSFSFTQRQKLYSAATLALAPVVIFLSLPYVSYHIYYFKFAYSPFYCLGIYTWTAVMSYCFMAVVPKTETLFSANGKNTMYVYLLHGFFINALFWKITAPPLIIIAGSVALTFALSSRVIKSLTWPLIEPQLLDLNKLHKLSA